MGTINTLRLLRQVRRDQWLTISELEDLQSKKLRMMIKHAYENTEFYHQKFRKAGIKPDDIKTVNDLEKIPFTSKAELREHSLGSMLSKNVDPNKCNIPTTSGSTGIPTKVVYDEPASDFCRAMSLRAFLENGMSLRSKWAVFGDPRYFKEQRWFQKFGILSPLQVSVFDPVEKQISTLRKFKPDVIGGYTSSIKLLAKAVEENNVKDIKPKVIFGTSELLDHGTREYINSIFNIEMIDHFGCVELNSTAWECKEHVGYHINIDAVVMEFINDGENVSNGERGEIVYTGLYNYAMPLIRYKVGDIGIPTDEVCPCGRGLPLMKVIEGRTDSFMQVPSGRIFPAMIWEPIMRHIPGIGQFKAIQEKTNFIRILVVCNDDFSERTIQQIEHDIKEIMGEEINVKTEIVDEIQKDKSGKVRCAVSNVKIDFNK